MLTEHRCTGMDCPICDADARRRANQRLAVLSESEREAFNEDYRKWRETWPTPQRKESEETDE